MQSKYISLVCLMALSMLSYAQQDSAVIDRTVYVTRDFQPTVESAGKISVKPQIFVPSIEVQEPEYSSFSSPLKLDYTMNKLDFSTLNFRQPDPLRGYLRAGVGHTNTLFSFNYRVTDSDMQIGSKKKKNSATDMILDLHANHRGQWGKKALSESCLGLDFSKQFSKAEMFFGAEGGNEYFHRYAEVLNPQTQAREMVFGKEDDLYKQMIWMVDTKIGAKSLPGADTEFSIQTGYEAFVVPGMAMEHQVHTEGMLDWKQNFHHVGAELDIENRFYSQTDTALGAHHNHYIHLEPYYAYNGKQFRVHAGVNLDFSIFNGKVPGISPNVILDADIARNWAAVYAVVTGHYAADGAGGEYKENRFRSLDCLFNDTISSDYTPIDMEIGFKIRPYATLQFNVHAGYALTLNQHVNVYMEGGARSGLFTHQMQDVSVWKVGGDLHYHYRDIVNVNLSGDYFAGKSLSDHFGMGSVYFDAPSWRVSLRVDGKINEKWSLYSDNHLSGGRKACVFSEGDVERHPDMEVNCGYRVESLRPMWDLNLGVQYNVNRWLSVYAQLNNYLAWTEKLSYSVYYGYEAMRANCLFGLSWVF